MKTWKDFYTQVLQCLVHFLLLKHESFWEEKKTTWLFHFILTFSDWIIDVNETVPFLVFQAARWKMAISAFFSLPASFSALEVCFDAFLPFSPLQRCDFAVHPRAVATAELKRHCSIKPVNGAVSSHPRKSIKVFPSHFALAVSWQYFAPKKKKKHN